MNESPDNFLRFIGNFHPILVHLPIALVPLVAVLELLSFRKAWRHVAAANNAILLLAIPAAAAAAVCGWLLAGDGGYDAVLVDRHRWTGVTVAILVPIVAWLRITSRRSLYRLSLGFAVGLVGFAGHLGGSITHGRDFLFRHAPAPLRRLAGVAEPARPAVTAPPASAAAATDFDRTVQPIFAEYCTSCHGAEKQKGKLRLDSHAAIIAGGESGTTVVPGSAALSLLIQRMRLPEGDDERMPPEGKPQPSPDHVATLSRWIDGGAGQDATVRGQGQ